MMTDLLTKNCERCGAEYAKAPTCGRPAWARSRYCSKQCQIDATFRSGREPWNKGLEGYSANVVRTDEWKQRISVAQKGKPHLHQRGSNHHNWKDGRSKQRRDLRDLRYVAWRTSVFERDDFTCQMCSIRGGDLESHHVIPWANDESRRFDLDNGVTLCRSCHRETKGHEEDFVEQFQMIAYTRT